MTNTISKHCIDNTLLIPESLFGMDDATPVMSNGGAAIFYKCIRQDMTGIEFYTNAPCLAFVLRGEETFTLFDQEEIRLRRGEMLFMAKNLFMLSDFTNDDGPLEAFLFFFDHQTIAAFKKRILKVANVTCDHRPYKIQASEPITQYMFGLRKVYESFQGTPELLQTKLLELLLLIDALDDSKRFRAFLAGAARSGDKRNIKHLMREHCLHRLTVKDFAALSGRSPASFNRDFKRQFGTTPSRWLIEAKLEKAHQLVLDTGLSVTEIALEVGYENSSHFIKAFKAKYGLTPKKARAQILS